MQEQASVPFTQKDAVSSEEWLRLIQVRRALIAPHLASFTLPQLDEFEFLFDGDYIGHQHAMCGYTQPKCDGGVFSLKTRGIFIAQHHYERHYIPNTGFWNAWSRYNDGTVLI